MKPAIPATEEERLQALYGLRLLDTACEEAYDRITRLAAKALNTPFAVMSLIDRDRQVLKSVHGGEKVVVSRDDAFCSHTILQDKPLIVGDARRDQRFADNPFVAGEPHVRFYTGVPFSSLDGHRLGALCVYDLRPRRITAEDVATLSDLACTVQDLVRAHETRRRNMRRFMRTYHDTMVVP